VAFTSIYRLTHILVKKGRVIHDKTAPSRRRLLGWELKFLANPSGKIG